MHEPRFITVAEVAQRLGLSRSTSYDLVRRLPPGTRVRVGQLVRIDAEALEQWIKAGGDLEDSRQE